MENREGAPVYGTPSWSAQREAELLLLLGGSRKAAQQLWMRKQRVQAMAQQDAGRQASKEAKGQQVAAQREAGGRGKPETGAQVERRRRSERRLREKHLARKAWAAVRVWQHLCRWGARARASLAARPASTSTTSSAASSAPAPATLPPPPPASTPFPASAGPIAISGLQGPPDEPMPPPRVTGPAAKTRTPPRNLSHISHLFSHDASPPAQPAAPKKTRGGAAFAAAIALAAPATVAGPD